jgi:coenzyme F420-dependent glucose-6-phosphate dehydrogenase
MAVELGYALSSEEHDASALVRHARAAEEAGFGFALISDHFHPWIDEQGQSPFVWSVFGGIAATTERLKVGTGVTCPIGRIHPAIIAHAAATVATMMPGRFFLGVGTGEALNEHVIGMRWPAIDERLDMLEESIDLMRTLWSGGFQSVRGEHFRVEQARLYSLPSEPPPVMVAASGDRAAELAGRLGDGLIGTSPSRDTISAFTEAGGEGKPRYGQIAVCWAEDEDDARATAYRWWPNSALKGELTVELPLPRHFEQAVENLSEDDVARTVVCGPDVKRHLDAINEYADAGYDHVYIHQVGPDQEGFLRFYEREVIPALR